MKYFNYFMKYCVPVLYFISPCFISAILFSCISELSNPDNTSDTEPIENTTEIQNFDHVDPHVLTQVQVDSLFNDLTNRTQECAEIFENAEKSSDLSPFFEKDFISISNSFAGGLQGGDINDPKMNIGYIISTAMALNTSKSMKKLIDSLGKYIDECDMYYNKKRGKRSANALSKTLYSSGLSGIGKVLAAEIPRTFNSQVARPSFPRFITLSYIQNIVEGEIIPIINNIVNAVERIENNSTVNIIITLEDEAYEIDLSDIYFLDAGLRLLRGSLYYFTVYDMDLYTSSTDQTYSWIDEIQQVENGGSNYNRITSLSGDTLYKTYSYSELSEEYLKFLDIMHYNYTRPGFLTIRRENHVNCYNDLKSAPSILKKAITLFKAESDNQDDDLIPNINFQENIDEEMIDIKQELIEEGFSTEFADNFSSPEKFLDFVEKVFTSPFLFNETIDGVSINITIDISKFFTDPITDLRKHFPRHVWRDTSNWIVIDTNTDISSVHTIPKDSLKIYSYDSLNIAESLIDTIIEKSYYSLVILNTSYSLTVYRTIDEDIYPVDLTDNTGNVITPDEIEALIDSKQFFPYFDDYTLNGIFPGMTRDKWINIIYQQNNQLLLGL